MEKKHAPTLDNATQKTQCWPANQGKHVGREYHGPNLRSDFVRFDVRSVHF